MTIVCTSPLSLYVLTGIVELVEADMLDETTDEVAVADTDAYVDVIVLATELPVEPEVDADECLVIVTPPPVDRHSERREWKRSRSQCRSGCPTTEDIHANRRTRAHDTPDVKIVGQRRD